MTSTTATDVTLPMRSGHWPRLQLGERVGRYRLTAVLGAGAMGVVYRGFDPVLGRDVALKSLHVQDVYAQQRFVQEARAMARVSHPHVVQAFDVVRSERPSGEGPQQWLIAMELVEGQTLDRWLQTPRSTEEIVEAFAAAGRGLVAAHAAGLVHRDFKPANVIVGRDGRVRVTDFGLSVSSEERAVTLDEGGSSTSMSIVGARGVTFPGVVVGTPAYMAPEQHRGAMLGPAADQFAFCAALFEALYGVRPFDGRSCRELSEQKHEGEVRVPQGSRPVPAWLRRVVLRGLRVEPAQRFASMLALLAALAGPKARRRPWRALRAAVLLSLLGGGLGVAVTGGAPVGQSAAGSSLGSAGTPSTGTTG